LQNFFRATVKPAASGGFQRKADGKPVAKFRAGQLSAAIWENEITVNGKKATMLKASVQIR